MSNVESCKKLINQSPFQRGFVTHHAGYEIFRDNMLVFDRVKGFSPTVTIGQARIYCLN